MNMPNELTDAILYCLFSGILSAGAVTGVFLLLRVMLYVPFMQKKWLEKAKEKGNYATALLFKYPLAWSFSNGRELWSYFVYRFSVNGKDYKVRVKLYRACLPSSGQGTHGILAQESLSRCG